MKVVRLQKKEEVSPGSTCSVVLSPWRVIAKGTKVRVGNWDS